MSVIPSLTDLVNRVRKGDAKAVGLIQAHYEDVLVRAVRDTLNPDNPLRSVYWTDDIKQTVYRRLLEMAANRRSETATTAPIESGSQYLQALVSNRVCDHGRRQQMIPSESVVVLATDPALGPEVQAELRDMAQKVMGQLSPAHREIAIRRRNEDTWQEIAPEDQARVERAFQRACRELTNRAAED